MLLILPMQGLRNEILELAMLSLQMFLCRNQLLPFQLFKRSQYYFTI